MNYRARIHSRRRGPLASAGYTMIEVLVTATVMLVSLTGMLSLQVVGIRAVQSTQQRTQATALAYRISDALRANRGSSWLPGTALAGAYDDLRLCDAAQRHPYDQRHCDIDAAPDPAALAPHVADWWQALQAAGLPNWFAAVQRVAPGDAADRRFRIVVHWDDSRVNNQYASAATRPSCLSLPNKNQPLPMPADMQEVCMVTEL